MKNTYKVTVIINAVRNSKVNANNLAEAKEIAEGLPLKSYCPQKPAGWVNKSSIKVNLIKGEEPKPDIDSIGAYEAQSIECTKCDNWEEGSSPWSSFNWDELNEQWKCSKCESYCVKETEFTEYRDEE